MPLYEFISEGCKHGGDTAGCCQVLEFPMSKAPGIGKTTRCPVKGCKRKLVRIISSGVNGIIKGQVGYNWKPGESMRMNVMGQDTRFQFIDHKHTDPRYQRNLAELAGKSNLGGSAHGINNARYDEKSGRMVVDVLSNVKDPLGAFTRAKKSGQNYAQEKIPVNQKYKVRPKAKRK